MITDNDKHIIKTTKEILENTPLSRELLKQCGFENTFSNEYVNQWTHKKAEVYGINPVKIRKIIDGDGTIISCSGYITLPSGNNVSCDLRTLKHLKTYIQLSKKSLQLHNTMIAFIDEIQDSGLYS